MVSKHSETQARWWGINKNGEVESIWERREGGTAVLERIDPDGQRFAHVMMGDRKIEKELSIVFGLHHAMRVPVHLVDSESEKRAIADLKTRPAEKKPS